MYFYKRFTLGASLGTQWYKESACQCRRHGFNPGSGNIPHAGEHVPQLLSLYSREAPTTGSLHSTTREQPPLTATREKPAQEGRPAQQKMINKCN